MYVKEISIHAPHTGRDHSLNDAIDVIDEFQSTRPIRGATFPLPLSEVRVDTISIHAPHTGRDKLLDSAQRCAIVISIHAPHTGRDSKNA